MDLRHGVVDPLADKRMPVLVHWEVVFASCDEGGFRVERANIEDCMNSYGEEVGEREKESMLRIEGGGVWWWGRHFESCVLWVCFLRTESLPSIYVVEEYHVLQPIRDLHK